MSIIITKLERPEHCGDWHDKPLKWKVESSLGEVQKFTTKKEAAHYRKIRRNSESESAAIRTYAASH